MAPLFTDLPIHTADLQPDVDPPRVTPFLDRESVFLHQTTAYLDS